MVGGAISTPWPPAEPSPSRGKRQPARDPGHRSSCTWPPRAGTGDLAQPGIPKPGTGGRLSCGSPRRGRTWGRRKHIGGPHGSPAAPATVGVQPHLFVGTDPIPAALRPHPTLAEAGDDRLSQDRDHDRRIAGRPLAVAGSNLGRAQPPDLRGDLGPLVFRFKLLLELLEPSATSITEDAEAVDSIHPHLICGMLARRRRRNHQHRDAHLLAECWEWGFNGEANIFLGLIPLRFIIRDSALSYTPLTGEESGPTLPHR